eukprot:g13276.t1
MLGPNEMIHGPEFTLYGAMSALELMDAKMDKPPPALESLDRRIASGTLPINLDASGPAPASSPPAPPPASPPAATPADSLPATDLSAAGNTGFFTPSRRALSVLDGMAVCEVAWHEGGSLPETLYACLYLHPTVFSAMLEGLGWASPPVKLGAPPRLDLRIKEGQFSWEPVDRALTLAVLAQSLATLRCCSLARDVIILADVFEEEDFYPSTFGFRLAPPVEDDSLTDLLALAKGAMRERIKVAGPQRRPNSQGREGDKPAGGHSTDECILAHLESRTQLLHACLALRDAFTNKQRLKRLRALEKRRAEELANSGGSRRAPDGEADTAEARVAAATALAAGGVGCGTGKDDDRTSGPGAQEDVEVDSEVVVAATGLAAMSLGRCSGRKGEQSSGPASGAGSGSRASGSTAGKASGNGRGSGVECDAGVAETAVGRGNDRPAAETGDYSNPTGLVVEGKAVTASVGETAAAATSPPMPTAPCAGTVLEKVAEEEEEEEEGEEQRHQRQAEEAEFDDDIETPLSGISRCEGHLRAAAVALESLLAIEASLEACPETPPVTPVSAVRVPPDSPQGKQVGATAARQEARSPARQPAVAGGGGSSKGADKNKEEPKEGFRLGGEAGAFAFEAEMNRHLLGSSPQHHVHFRRGRAEGPRALILLAREAGRACGVVRCEDLLGVRRCLMRLFQPPEDAVGAIIGTASLFARSVAAVCLYRQEMVLGRFDVIWFVAEAMTDVGVPDAVVTSPSGMAFLERVGKPVYETLRMLCLNRARQRTSLELQMQDWRTLQAYADNVDDAFQLQYGLAPTTQRYMSKWALTEVLGLMHRYLQIGVELQLPSAHEWSGTYWYWDYVMTTKMMTEGSLREAKEQLEEVKAQIEGEREQREAQEAAEAAAASAPPRPALTGGTAAGGGGGGSKKSKKKKRGGNKNKKPKDVAEAIAAPGGGGGTGDRPSSGTAANGTAAGNGVAGGKEKRMTQKTEREISWAARRDWEMADMKLRQCLCRGTVRLVAGLESLGMMGQKAGEWPEFRFTSLEIVHRERFRAFQALDSPAFQSHQTFLKAIDFDEKEAAKVVDASAECFRAARTLASDLLRRGDSATKAAAAAAAAVTTAPADVASGGANGTLSPFVPAAGAGEGLAAGSADDPGGEEAWAMDRLELLAMAKLAVSNGVAAMQVVKHSSSSSGAAAAAATGGGKEKGKGKVKLDFGSHGQFPAVKVTFS